MHKSVRLKYVICICICVGTSMGALNKLLKIVHVGFAETTAIFILGFISAMEED